MSPIARARDVLRALIAQLRLVTTILVVVVAVALAPRAAATTEGDGVLDISLDAGCVEVGPTGYYPVEKDGDWEFVFVVDLDGDQDPDRAWCAGRANESNYKTLSASSPTSCSGLNSLLPGPAILGGHGCDFRIDIWVGSAGSDDDGASGPVDCSAHGYPVMMFGLGDEDKLRSTDDFGDFVHLGDGNDEGSTLGGPDYLCGSRGHDSRVNTGDGNDVGFRRAGHRRRRHRGGRRRRPGGRQRRHRRLRGRGGRLQRRGRRHPEVYGGGDVDRIHLGLGADADGQGQGSNDLVFAQDSASGPDTVSGGGGTDTCYVDSGDTVSCETSTPVRAPQTLDLPLIVGAREPGSPTTGWLYEMDWTGSGTGYKVHYPGTSALAEHIIGLAIDPGTDDTLYALIKFAGQTYPNVVTIDLSAQPTGGYYETSNVGTIVATNLVDLAMDSEGVLHTLSSDATWKRYATGASLTVVASEVVGRRAADWSHDQIGYNMAFDDLDAGFFLVLTNDPHPEEDDELELQALDGIVYTGSSDTEAKVQNLPLDDHIDQLGTLPFTFTEFLPHDAAPGADPGSILTIEKDGSTFPMWHIKRMDWTAHKWTFNGTCTTQCFATIDSGYEVTAITSPHFYEP